MSGLGDSPLRIDDNASGDVEWSSWETLFWSPTFIFRLRQANDVGMLALDPGQNFWATRRTGRSPLNIPVDHFHHESGALGDATRDYSPLVSISAIWPAYSCASCCTSGIDREASGLGKARIWTPGIPSEEARACAARVKLSVMTLTEGTPRVSVTTVSWRPHAVQLPQSAIPCTTASHCSISSSMVSSEHGALKLNLRR